MKKRLFLLIILPIVTNMSYASFPVTEDLKSEIIEEAVVDIEIPRRQDTYAYAILSFLLALFGFFMIFITFAAAYGQDTKSGFYLVITIAAMIAAVVLGLTNIFRKEKGYFLSLLGSLLGLLGFIMIIGSK